MIKENILLFSILLSILLIPNVLKSQYVLKGNVIDADSQQPLACVQIYISCYENDLDTRISTDKNGSFSLNNLPENIYIFHISKDYYRPIEHELNINHNVEGKVKLTNRMQLGFRYSPLKVKWMAMNSDTMLT